MPESLSDIHALKEAAGRFGALCEAVSPEQWDLPTPCTDWNVEQLVDHVLGGNWYTIEVLGGSKSDAAFSIAIAAFADMVDRPGAFAESSAAQQIQFESPGALDGQFHHVVGLSRGRDVLRLRIHELIIHGWDLATSLGLPTAIDFRVLEWTRAELSADGSVGRHFGIETFTPTGADPQVQLLAAFGRTSLPLPS